MMKYDEFAFVNRQLAGMLQAGIPLEGALRQLCQTMRQGDLRTELTLLEQDLAKGMSLTEAPAHRQLPPFYVAMLKVGVESNQLPKVLILLADYYQKLNSIGTRLKGLMVYPAIVLGASLLLSVAVAVLYGKFAAETGSAFFGVFPANAATPSPSQLVFSLWLPVGLIALVTTLVLAGLAIPGWRRHLRWRLPAFREAGLSQLAWTLALMLENGCSLKQALELVRHLEAGTPAHGEIEQWQTRLAAGHKQFAEIASGGKIIPPLFVWLVTGSGEDWVSGFRHAAEIYYARALHRIELLLYAALPAAVIALGFLIVCQVVPIVRVFLSLMQSLGSVGME